MLRRTSFAALSAASLLLLTACGSSGDNEAGEGGAGGVTLEHPSINELSIDFDSQPESIVMDCYAYSSLHEYGIKPTALFGYECDNPFVMGDADTEGIEVVGRDGEIDVEKLASLRPDAIVGQGTADGWQWFGEDVNKQMTRVASFVPLPGGDTIPENITATREIAEFFGADVTADAIVEADEEMIKAEEELRTALAEKNLNVMLASPTKEMLYTAVGFSQAEMLKGLGATIVGPKGPTTGNRWGEVAWEDASTYRADLLLVEGYSDDYAFTSDLWEALPAVKADQVGAWSSKGAMTSRAYADWLNDVAEMVTSATKVA